MGKIRQLTGVFAAVVTPLYSDLSLDLDGLASLIAFLANRGCHGILLTGTTGEGPSFSIQERLQIYKLAGETRRSLDGIKLLAGTGTPSLDDTIFLTREAFNQGFDGVVVLPPYYFRKATDEGLFNWFSNILKVAVPGDGALLGYHIPPVSGVGFSFDLLARLRDSYPDQFFGIKDSSGDPEYARALGDRFGSDLCVLNGNDRLFSLALQSKASGCITAMANLHSPLLRLVWDDFQSHMNSEINQDKLIGARQVLDQFPPMPPLIKALLNKLHGFPEWKVKPPLVDMDAQRLEIVLSEFIAATG
ncbi:MAG: dihydrodipicolinate synthase family protein [Acidobacteriaceae bacterium]